MRNRWMRSLPAAAILAMGAAVTMALRPGATACDPACPWERSNAPIAARVAQVLSKLTLDEKIQLLHGTGGTPYAGYVPAIPRLCIPALKLHDGPGGVADGLAGVTQLPAPVAVAASWDTALARQYGAVIGAEEWGKGANVNLGPTVNIVRDPRFGRAFETYGEDPFLTGRIAVAEIQGVQSEGVMAQVKHWVAYNQETFRNTPADDVVVARRTLHEIYMPQFEAAVREGGASSVMCAYSTVNGSWACQHGYTQLSVLKGAWRFPGFITSDWGATHSTVASADSGLDMQMPDSSRFGSALRDSVLAGRVPMARLDDMVRRILTQMFRFHLFEREQTGTPSSVVTTADHAAVARSVAEQGTVLLKNAGGLLPLGASVRSIAVIGPSAGRDALTGGGGSAAVVAPYVVTPFDAITRRAGGGIAVRYAEGVMLPSGPLPAVPFGVLTPASGGGRGLTAAFYNNMTLSGPPVLTRTDTAIGANWQGQPPAPGVNADQWSARWTGSLTAPTSGTYTFSLTSDDGSRLYVNGVKVIDNWRDQGPNTETGTVTLTAGQPAAIEVDFYQNAGGDSISFGWQPPRATSLLDEAVALARASDVAVVFVRAFESEGSDLADIALPGGQNELVAAVAAANPRTVVVLNTGSAVTMPWVDAVPAVLEAWYPGQEDGNAIASVLFGDVNPSGKLPVSFPKKLDDVPAAAPVRWPGVNGRVDYSEGLEVGYRWYQARDIASLFPFGFGLSYTTFRFANLHVSGGRSSTVEVSADVTNAGPRAGADVVQVYVSFPPSAGEPPRQLKGFRKVHLAPGEKGRVSFSLDARAFAYWDDAANGWVVSAGEYRIGVGDASDNLPLSAVVKPRPGRVD